MSQWDEYYEQCRFLDMSHEDAKEIADELMNRQNEEHALQMRLLSHEGTLQ